MPHSHHSHSGQFCKHASGTLEDVVKEAIRRGFEVYGLTEHVPRYRQQDFYPEEEGLDAQDLALQFTQFLDEAHRLKKLYATQIALLVGLETENITSIDLDSLDQLLQNSNSRVEYIVGSIHHVNGIPIDFDLPLFQKSLHSGDWTTEQEAQEQFLCAYFEAQHEVIQRFQPEIIGHIDLCRLYNPGLRISEYPRAWKLLERNVASAVAYGGLFEVNGAAFRKGWNTAYPAEDIAELILKHGGRFALSDDSHGPHAVGLNYSRMKDYLRRVNITELWYLQASNTLNEAGRAVVPVKVLGDWWDHVFWQ